ncbi:hypothetical protein SAMN03159496_01382 [Rhizobium sp. NFR07]|jgi:hypothetical protein|uniref:hypothetical protein n=1 Tax=Rhizobium sp. NFR07 TaxID=1566262 RepID=UPI0008F1647A|nr:hypothetical protein [Rhizobium sp. NFR07]SFB02861.1 hypothetical protein SAMN03159496_01382 [Rhizobium sp. NFR07]
MTLLILYILLALALFGGGALGAHLARVPAWKGGVIAFSAAALQMAVTVLLDIESVIVQCLIFLLLVGLIGGRFGLKLSARRLGPVVIGSFLLPATVALVYLYGVTELSR